MFWWRRLLAALAGLILAQDFLNLLFCVPKNRFFTDHALDGLQKRRVQAAILILFSPQVLKFVEIDDPQLARRVNDKIGRMSV